MCAAEPLNTLIVTTQSKYNKNTCVRNTTTNCKTVVSCYAKICLIFLCLLGMCEKGNLTFQHANIPRNIWHSKYLTNNRGLSNYSCLNGVWKNICQTCKNSLTTLSHSHTRYSTTLVGSSSAIGLRCTPAYRMRQITPLPWNQNWQIAICFRVCVQMLLCLYACRLAFVLAAWGNAICKSSLL